MRGKLAKSEPRAVDLVSGDLGDQALVRLLDGRAMVDHRIDLAGADYRQNALIVHVAEAACEHAQLADIGEGVILQPDDAAVAELGIGPESLAVILAEAQVQAERAAELIGFGR